MTTEFLKSPGDVIGDRYRVEGYVNEGGMQQVYKAEDLLLQKYVALKVPKNSHATKRFRRSAVVSARVNHANVAKTLDYIEADSRSYLIEEFIDGEDLSKALKTKFTFLDPILVAWILHRLAKGIASSHHAGVIHRDLKPSNIMVEGGNILTEVKITDFGIAKMAEDELEDAIKGGEESLTASQTAIGAIPYMAPEIIDDIKGATSAADIWSLGAMTYELLTGKKPFGAGLRAVTAIQQSEPAPIDLAPSRKLQFSNLFDELASITASCLVKDSSRRPTADNIVSACEKLCYPIVRRETGTVKEFNYGAWGFISADNGQDVFFHLDSVYSESVPNRGDRVSFARHIGGGNDRAFPVIRIL